jgi:three-Cys-motif partner protein
LGSGNAGAGQGLRVFSARQTSLRQFSGYGIILSIDFHYRFAVAISEHEFGSRSTDLKLSIVEGYLRAFTTALSGKFSNLVYIDAYAGTGERTEYLEASEETLLDPASPERIERRRGSARIAIEVKPHFDRLIFIEKNARHSQALNALREEHPMRCIEVRNGSAEEELGDVLKRNVNSRSRGVLFLDPYGMDVSWKTLEMVQATEALDVWYLVSLEGLFRQAVLDYTELTPNFSATVIEIKAWFQKRLSTLFPNVVDPLVLYNSRNVPSFALFFLVLFP